MNSTNVATLNEHLLRRPEPIREGLALYITEHLEEIEEELKSSVDSFGMSDELKAELDRRLEAYDKDPTAGVGWEELDERLSRLR